MTNLYQLMSDGTYQPLAAGFNTAMLHLRLPATWANKTIEIEGTVEIEKILYLILAMLDCGLTTYEISQRLMLSGE